MLNYLRRTLAPENPFRQIYYRFVAFIAALFYGFPGNKMTVISVTGTKGKTTTCNLITSVLRESGHKVGMATTVNIRVGDNVWSNKTKMTTMGRFALQKLLKQMLKEGCKYAILEVSSIALTQNRLYGINTDIAVITNMQSDHLEYHGSFKKYREAKGLLFKNLNTSRRKVGVQKVAILNRDDAEFSYFDKFLADRKITYGLRKTEVKVDDIELLAHGSIFKIILPNQESGIYLPFPGMFNVYNALAAASVAVALGIDLKTIKRGFENCPAVPGRTESIHAGQEYTIIVDYAHTTESLENICQLFKNLSKGKQILVFGCTGGGRDKAKRPLMGKVADKYADCIILTDDDPYEEDRYEIIQQIAGGIKRKEGDDFWKIIDRREAIRFALTLAKKGDTVIIAGKGGEEVMATANGLIPWNDKDIVLELLARTVTVEFDGDVKTGTNKCFAA